MYSNRLGSDAQGIFTFQGVVEESGFIIPGLRHANHPGRRMFHGQVSRWGPENRVY